MKSIQTFLERFNYIPFEEKLQILFQTWETFFAIQCSQPEDSNELFQKLLKDFKELAEYDQSTSTDRLIFLNDNEDHSFQNKESLENSSEENVVSKTNQESPQYSNIHQLIEECSVEIPEKQKQKMEDTMFDLVEICDHKQFLCIHDDINDLIKSALNSKLLLINSNSQHLDKQEKEVKNVVEQPAERRNQPEHLLSMVYEHFSITPETESDEVTESNAENLLPILSKCEVTLEDEIEHNMPAKDDCSLVSTFSNPLFKDNDDLDSSDVESLPDEDVPAEEFKIYLNSLFDEDEINSNKLNPCCFNVESDFVESLLNRDTFIDFSSKFDFSGELAHIKPEIPKSDFDFKEEIQITDTIIESIPLLPIPVQDGNSQQEEIDIVTKTNDVLPPSVENDNDNYDLLLGEVDLFLFDNSIPLGIKNVVDDPEGDVRFLEELLINDSILSHESFDSNLEENPLIPRPPPEPPDVESFFDLKPDELAEYDQSTSTDRPNFVNNNHPENSSEENVVSKTNQEPPQDSDIHQLIEECCVEVPEKQKQKMADTMFDLIKICHHKQFLCIHDDVDDLIKSALNSKLLLINPKSQHPYKKEQEVKNVEEQQAERRNRAEKSLQNFRVIYKSSISVNSTSQISSIHSIAPIQSTEEPEHLLSMRYEHLSITPETESDEVTESNAENLLPILSKCEVTLEDEIECNMPAKDVYSLVFTTFSNPLFKDNDDLDSSDNESLSDEDVPAEEFKFYSNHLFDEDEINSDKLDSHCFKVESDFVESLLNRDTFIDFSSKFDFSGELAHIKPEIPKSDFDFEEEIHLIENLLYDNSFPRPPKELNAKIADTIIESIPLLPIPVQDGNSQQEEIDIVTSLDDVLPPSVDNDDDLSLLEEAELFLSDNSIPQGIENVADDPEGDVRFLKELLINDSILSHESFDSNLEENLLAVQPDESLGLDWLNLFKWELPESLGGGWTNGRMTRHHRYCSSSSEKSVRGVSRRFRKSVRGSEIKYKVKRIENKAKKDAATWRRLAANDLCTRYCEGGSWTNGRMTRHRRYCSSSSEKSVRGFEIQYKVQKLSTRFKKKSNLEAEVAQDDWWIKNITAANDEI
uniref:Uncharacterized protein n=1 Tax=Tanacetum cinerariifolium TaxID=118510 RepID=A0A6L2KZN5_TANCI|nr:hypothetical protein [Tanacetum cinerariifolium]